MAMTDVDIMPTPGAVGAIMQAIAKKYDIDVVGVDIGGATTDVFSVFQEIFNRSVSANLGMSYSISNVFAEATLENIMRWVPFDIDERDLRNRIKNKMIRPTSIPYLLEELVIDGNRVRMKDFIGLLSPTPILLLHGALDATVTLPRALDLFRAANDPKEFVVFPCERHTFEDKEALMRLVLSRINSPKGVYAGMK